MGVVIKQSFWTSIFAYLGAFLGLINQLFVYPYFLSKEQVGLFSQIQSFAMLIAPLAILGMTATAVKFNSTYKENLSEKRAFNSYLFMGSLIGLIVVILVIAIFREQIISFYSSKSPLVDQYFETGVILIGILTFLALNEAISRANLKSVLPSLLKDVLVRSLSLILLLLYGFKYISFDYAVTGIIFLYVPSLIVLFYVNMKAGYLTFGKDLSLIKLKFKKLNNYALYSVLGSAGTVIVLNVDIQMVSGMLGLDQNGIYTRAFYMAVLIELPRRAISQIATPVIANAFKNNEFETIKRLYKNLSINQMVIGGLLIIGITVNLDNIYNLMPNGEEYKTGAIVVFIVGAAKIIDMAFSVNSEIILMSKYYRFSTYSIVILSVLTIALNLILIPIYGINGAAIASLVSIMLFNLLKMVFIKIKYKMIPFSIKNLYLIVIIGAIWYLNQLIPQKSGIYLDILIRSTIVTVLFCGLVVLLRVSEDINMLITRFLKNYKKDNL